MVKLLHLLIFASAGSAVALAGLAETAILAAVPQPDAGWSSRSDRIIGSSVNTGVALPLSAATVSTPAGQNAPYRWPAVNPATGSMAVNAGPQLYDSDTDVKTANAGSPAVLLENGCIAALDLEPSATVPFFCVPLGLGSRFVSVFSMSAFNAVGGVTDTGNMVFTGLGDQSNRCGYINGPWTPQVTVAFIETSRQAASPLFLQRWNGGSPSISYVDRWVLCGLLRSGDIECMRPRAPWFFSANTPQGTPWKDYTTATSAGNVPSDSPCADLTRQSNYVSNSQILCQGVYRAARAGLTNTLLTACTTMHGPFTTFTISSCDCPTNLACL